MAKYTTYQQHEPLRVPEGWNANERKLIAQLEEILDDLYRRFNRLKLSDLSESLRTTVVNASDGVTELTVEVGQISGTVFDIAGNMSTLQQTVDGIDVTISGIDDSIAAIQTTISAQADSIALKVSKNEVVSEINQTSEQVKISADRIALEGVTTINENFKVLADGSMEAKNGKFYGAISTDYESNLTTGRWFLDGDGLRLVGPTSPRTPEIEVDLLKLTVVGAQQIYNLPSAALDCDCSLDIKTKGALMLRSATCHFWFINRDYGNIYYTFLSSTIGYIVLNLQNTGTRVYFAEEPREDGSVHCVLGTSDCRWLAAYINTIHYSTLSQDSARALKKDIAPLVGSGALIDQLAPVTYAYRADDTGKQRFGLIYEDTEPIVPQICVETDDEQESAKGIDYATLSVLLLKEVQDLRARVAALEAKV